MKRIHRMPFGAEVDGDGTRFRLWAPNAARVDVMLGENGHEREHALDRADGGWFEVRLGGRLIVAGATSPSMAGPSKRGSGFFGAGAGGTVTA